MLKDQLNRPAFQGHCLHKIRANKRDLTDLGLETSEATDPENLARPALDGIVGADGVVRVARDGVLVLVG